MELCGTFILLLIIVIIALFFVFLFFTCFSIFSFGSLAPFCVKRSSGVVIIFPFFDITLVCLSLSCCSRWPVFPFFERKRKSTANNDTNKRCGMQCFFLSPTYERYLSVVHFFFFSSISLFFFFCGLDCISHLHTVKKKSRYFTT